MRDSQVPPTDEPPEPPENGPGRVRPTGPVPLVVFALVGLVVGWLVRPLATRSGAVAPTIGWLPVVAVLFVAVVLAAVAWSTYQTLHRQRARLPAYQAVNRLVLAKACALTGAAVGGGYLGYALSWVEVAGTTGAALVRERLAQGFVGALAGALVVVTALLLERACRVRPEGRNGLR